ncbi:hypothetical protein PybrP1_009971 [[Pythium] brassicae (nom. inval.)]|nr:hypothetical protein PybrP1_009971 [[Pythium] brassicae (nom. inval.)]
MHLTATIPKRMDAQSVRASLTDKYATDKFAMEYAGYLSNHLLHGAVALFELGASAEQVEDFAAHYAQEKLLAVAPDHDDPFDVVAVDASDSVGTGAAAVPTPERLAQLLGKREDFDALLAFYGREVQLLGADGAVQKHLPQLVAGLCGALLHGLIQLGYAYHIGGDRLIAEGLAYFHFSYLSFEDDRNEAAAAVATSSQRAFSREEVLPAIHALKNHELVLSEVQSQLATNQAVAALPIGLFQKKLNALSAHPERGSRAAFDAISTALAGFDLSGLHGAVALDFALWLYAMIAHNDFVIAHAVTSAWSLQQLEHLLDERQRVRAWRVWLHVAVTAFILQDVRDLSDDDVCGRAPVELPTLQSWDEIVGRALALQGHPDEHVYKVVQVALDHAGGDRAKTSSFLSADEREFVARSAAAKVVALDFERI